MTKNQTPKAKTVTTRYCNCGCGEATSSSKTAYKPGHDARHAGKVARDFAAYLINGGAGTDHSMLDELSSPKLQAKARSMAKRIVEQVAAKATKAARPTKAASKAAGKKAADTLAAKVTEEEAAHAEAEAAKRAEIEAELAEIEAELAAEEDLLPLADVKVGRWTYPVRRSPEDAEQLQRNTKRDGSGEWVDYNG